MRLLPLLLAATLVLPACGQQEAAPVTDAAPSTDTAPSADPAPGTAEATPASGAGDATGPQPGEPGAVVAPASDTGMSQDAGTTPLPGEPGGPDAAPMASAPTAFDPASVPESSASLNIGSTTFCLTLVTVILLLNFLSFLPSMVLGPIGEALQLAQHSGAAK